LTADADQPWYDAVEQRFGVKLKIEVPPQSNSAERLQLVMASGTYPDVIRFMNSRDKSYMDGVRNGIIIPVTKYLEHAPNIQKYTYEKSWAALRPVEDGEIYGIPVTSAVRNDGYAVREDWLDAVGLTLPDDGIVTLDAFTEILRRFTENDPDGNGSRDTYGLGKYGIGDGTIGLLVPGPYESFGWQKYDDEAYPYMDRIYSKTSDAYRRALRYSADIFKAGLVDPNSPLLKRAQAEERFAQGVTGVLSFFAGHLPGFANNLKKSNPAAELAYITGIRGEDGNVTMNVQNSTLYGMWSVTKTAANPQKIVDLFDYLLSDEGWELNLYGVEGVHYTVNDGVKTASDLFAKLKHNGMMRRKENVDLWANELTMTPEWLGTARLWLDRAVEHVTVLEDRDFLPPISADGRYQDGKTNLDTVVTKIVLGESPVSDYEAALEKWYANGGETYVQQMNDYIAQAQQ
jgi:putative aldouronate transport system substrate-binding protein